MNFRKPNRKITLFIMGGVALAAFLWWTMQSPKVDTTSNLPVNGRSAYAQLYDAFWRADDGTSPTLVTATLFTPSVTMALDQAGEKTTSEQQIHDLIQPLPSSSVGFLVTINSVSGSYSDAEVKKSFGAKIDAENLVLDAWQPIVATAAVVNAPAGASAQEGVAIFHAKQPINWTTLQSVQLKMTGLQKTGPRTFTWSGTILDQSEL